jgi:thiamine biosynthesis protein ThiS
MDGRLRAREIVEGSTVKIIVDEQERDVGLGTRLSHLVAMIEDERKHDAMVRALLENTGKASLTFVLNGRVIKGKDYDKIEIREGDRLNVIHPVFGG